ncbi:competence type IV pilus assembly protein ComGB [Priestia taiwanensis]|uniref:Competence protein ComG n=1 Tax=Priestia taiwanensis TaxID=1347902 RepID=A0A917ER21_9BACI|nr:competence type IV pilus assembly protein ComGB [Priestia taiwanensis]MBM7363810.1 competence protein ComGB [Priestia taiwanensis]GGE73924.1 competence protein ComG [Priestia taiwanensis]
MKKQIWKLKDQALFLQRLGDLLGKGYSLLQALEFLHLQMSLREQQQLMKSVDELKKGAALHDVLKELYFHRDVLAYFFYAHNHGDLSFACKRAALILQKKVAYQTQLSKIARYPLFLVTFLFFILLFFNMILLPQFQTLFETMNVSTSSFTVVVFFLLRTFPSMFVIFIVFLLLFLLYYHYFFCKLPQKQQVQYKLLIPYVRTIVRIMYTYYFSSQFSSLLQGGLSVTESLAIMNKQRHHTFFREEAKELMELLKEGRDFSELMANRTYYEQDISYIIAHGQANGTLSIELEDYSEYLLEKLEQKLKAGMAVIQPVVYGSIAVIVIMVYIAMLIPMFQLLGSI